MIEPTDEMIEAQAAAFSDRMGELLAVGGAFDMADPKRAGLKAALAVYERDRSERLLAAERLCYMYGISAAHHETDREKAAHEVWKQWFDRYRHDAPEVTQDEIDRLAAQRDAIRAATLERLRGEPS